MSPAAAAASSAINFVSFLIELFSHSLTCSVAYILAASYFPSYLVYKQGPLALLLTLFCSL